MFLHPKIHVESWNLKNEGSTHRGVSGAFFTTYNGQQYVVKREQAAVHPEALALEWAIQLDLPGHDIWLPGITPIQDGILVDRIRGYQDVCDLQQQGEQVSGLIGDERLELIALFDLLIGNYDRHTGNYGLTPDNSVWLIDNGGTSMPLPTDSKKLYVWNVETVKRFSPIAARYGLEVLSDFNATYLNRSARNLKEDLDLDLLGPYDESFCDCVDCRARRADSRYNYSSSNNNSNSNW